ncbi:Alpha/Beta hydrolase protein [Xylariaceae sp. FL0016]|nr:Alpha/Beta hydrolase protein [Xylariaceae sp. FL0016]
MFSLSLYRLFAAAAWIAAVSAASLTKVSDFGENPTKLSMYVYVPDKLAAKPPVIIVPHPCGGSAQDTYSRIVKLPSYADKLGFVLIFPSTPNSCWDNTSAKSLTHDGGGDTTGLANMVRYALTKYGGDPTKIFTTGSSSGGMITNVLLAAYPDLFAGGASFSGSPAGCWDGNGNGANCPASGKSFTAQQWGAVALKGYPSFNGTRPKMQVWHGTADTVVVYRNLEDQLMQWSNVLGVEFSKNATSTPQNGYTQITYGDGTKLVGYSAQGVGHMVPFHDEEVLKFFGLL